MKLRSLLVLAAIVPLAAACAAQLTPEQRATSLRVLEKIRKAEVYNQLLPVLMTPDQIKSLLPILEMHRAEAVKLEEFEWQTLKDFEPKLDAALKKSDEKGDVPEKDVMKNALVYFQAFEMKRKALIDDTVDKLVAKMKEKLNEGQIHAAANAFDPSIISSTLKVETLTDDKKLEYWVRLILMDNVTYDVLVALAKKKAPDLEQGPLLKGFNE